MAYALMVLSKLPQLAGRNWKEMTHGCYTSFYRHLGG